MKPITVVHTMTGRTRLRSRAQRGNPEWFARAAAVLSECPTVGLVETNARTGSILVRHSGELREVLEFARTRALFEPPPVPLAGPLASIRRSIRELDARVDERTNGEWNLNGLLFYGLLGASVYQIARGDLFPAAGTLVLQAMNVLRQGNTQAVTAD
jgi:hypothetical protein